MTAQYHLAVVTYDSTAGHLITRACGDVKVGVLELKYIVHYTCMCMRKGERGDS